MGRGDHSVLIIFALVIGITLVFDNNAAEAFDFPAVKIKSAPNENEFKTTNRAELLGDHQYSVMTRENGEHVDVYFFYTSESRPVIIFYFEDSTDEQLKNYRDFNSDFLFLYFKTDSSGTDERFIFAERHASTGCIVPMEHHDAFLAGTYSGCVGGATITKKTENGWAAYVKFFDGVSPPTNDNPFFISWSYGDILKADKDGVLEEISYYNWPKDLRGYGTVSLIEEKYKEHSVNSGKIQNNEFLYKPSEILTETLVANNFLCADDTIDIVSDQQFYKKDDVARFTTTIQSGISPVSVFLKIYDLNSNLIVEKSVTYNGKNKVEFLVDLDEFENGIHTAIAKFGINGPTAEVKFSMGETKLEQDEKSDCYFYSLYDANKKQLSLLLNIQDASFSDLDSVQIFIDKNGNGGKELDSDDVTFLVGKDRFGGIKFESDRGWLSGEKNEQQGDARINFLFNNYQVFVTIPSVSSNYGLALKQTDYNNFEIKKSQFPQNSFSTIPDTWSKVSMNGISKKELVSDKWIPKEIVLNQNLDVNLIIVGDEWEQSLQNKIKNLLEKKYLPVVSKEVSRAGIQYNYNYNFISASDQQSQGVFDFMRQEAQQINPFFGGGDFDDPWGIGVWVQNNHTEWISESQQRYEIDYKLIDAEKMENYLYENIISQDNNLRKSGSANLVFISDDTSKIDFLHNYKLKRTDKAQGRSHEAVGLMGFGGNYNFYFFDLYAVPWDDFQGFPFFYDYEMKNHATNYHDIITEEGRADLISNYVNNATSLIITPSYLYTPVYKNHYVLDLLIIADPGSTASIGTLTDYFINEEKIKSELEGLTPFSDWEIKVTVENRLSRDLPEEFKDVLKINQNIPLYDFPDSPVVDIIDSEGITKIITQWATTRTSSGIQDYKDVKQSSWTIPVVIAIGQRGNPIYIDQIGFTGLAPGNPYNPTQPCCALGVSYDNAVWDDQVSVTDLTIHEVAHTLSLMHPFVGYDVEGKIFANEYFNWYLSPMIYGTPPFGCGLWYQIYIEDGCGIIDTKFTKFEKDNFARGVTAYLMKAAETNVYRTLVNLETQGDDPSKPPIDVNNAIEQIDNLLDEARNSFLINDLLTDEGAIKNAYAAALQSEKLAKEYRVSYEMEGPKPKAQLQIPEWVKDNAGWWAADSISESDFINAIQYLIKERIIVIPDLPESGEAAGKDIPEWVKNNANWWASGAITDNEFVTAIQFLVELGIIRV